MRWAKLGREGKPVTFSSSRANLGIGVLSVLSRVSPHVVHQSSPPNSSNYLDREQDDWKLDGLDDNNCEQRCATLVAPNRVNSSPYNARNTRQQ